MNKQKLEKWIDPRPPAWQGIVKGAKITIYDMDAYHASLRQYPDDTDKPIQPAKKPAPAVPVSKQKPASRYNWTTKLSIPLKGNITSK